MFFFGVVLLRINSVGLNEMMVMRTHDIKCNDRKIVLAFFGEEGEIDFARNGIYWFWDNITFLKGHEDDYNSFDCPRKPCFLDYCKFGQNSDVYAPETEISFNFWLNNVLNPDYQTIKNVEHFKGLLKGHKNFYFGVNIGTIPEGYPKNQVFYSIPSSLLSDSGFVLNDGIYFFNSPEKVVIRVEDFRPIKSDMVDPFITNISTKPFFAGFFIELNSSSDIQNALRLVRNLNSDENIESKVYFSLIPRGEGMYDDDPLMSYSKFVDAGKYYMSGFPSFFVMNTSQMDGSSNRWLIRNDCFNESKIRAFLHGILNGTQKYSYISAPVSNKDGPIIEIVADNSYDYLYNGNTTSLMVITATWCSHCRKLKPDFETACNVLYQNGVQCLSFDSSSNEIPDFFPDFKGYPSIFLINPGGSFIEMSGSRNSSRIINFVNEKKQKIIAMFNH